MKRNKICKNCAYYVYKTTTKGNCDNLDIRVREVYPNSRCVFWKDKFVKPWYVKLIEWLKKKIHHGKQMRKS